ncbi:MAG: hypothetical protein KIS91_04565 [Anaerolineae bacterium]|nr:hypothetical protein [Anaerolineae bacterium]
MDHQGKLNKPITDEELYDAGVNRDTPEHEPPPPPLKLAKSVNWSSVGVEYRAMGNVTTVPPVQARRRSNDKAYAWLASWQPAPPAPAEEPALEDEATEAEEAPALEHAPIASAAAAEPPQPEA